MTLIAGSYERYLWGYKLKPTTATTTALSPLFSYPAHLSSIKSVAISAPIAASSSTDDTLNLYHLTATTSISLSSLPLTTSLTSLSFFSHRNLLAGAVDGSLLIFDVDPFVLLDTVPVHKKAAVNDVAVHVSGRVGLTVGRDKGFGMVNLVRGKRSFFCRLDEEASIVRYCEGDEKFFMVSDGRVGVHDAEDARIVGEFHCPKRVLCAAPGENGLIFAGGEDHGITAWDTLSGKVAYSIEDAHKSRVKGVVVLTRGQNSGADEDPFILASASSDGVIRVWDVRATSKDRSEPLCEANTKSRLTCLAGSSIKGFKQHQMKKDAQEEEAGAMEDS